MILLGSRARTRNLNGGSFYCARERAKRRYRLVVVRRWIRFGPMPLIPLEELSRFVECRSCASTYDIDVLHGHSQSKVEDVLTMSLRNAAATVLSSSSRELSPLDRREAVIVLQRYASVPYSSRDLDADLARATSDSTDTELRDLAPSLNDHSRDAVLDATVQLATLNHHETTDRLEGLRQVASALSVQCDSRRRRTIDRRLKQVHVAAS